MVSGINSRGVPDPGLLHLWLLSSDRRRQMLRWLDTQIEMVLTAATGVHLEDAVKLLRFGQRTIWLDGGRPLPEWFTPAWVLGDRLHAIDEATTAVVDEAEWWLGNG